MVEIPCEFDAHYPHWPFAGNRLEKKPEPGISNFVNVSFKDGDVQVFEVHNEGYILSDSGETIERVKIPDYTKNQYNENSLHISVEEESDS